MATYKTKTGKILTEADVEALAAEAERGYPFITCPRCGKHSFNPNDIEQGYCGACHWWTSDPILGEVDPDTMEVTEPKPDTWDCTDAEWKRHLAMRLFHSPFCSAAGTWPCPIGCEKWPRCSAEMFPNLTNACPDMCPVHGEKT